MTLFLLKSPRAKGVLRSPLALVLAAAFLLASYAATAVSGAKAEPRQAPNSRVSLDLEPKFQPSDRFSGFVDEKTSASFVIVEMPAQAYEELKKMPDRTDALAQRGLTDAEVKSLSGREGDYIYFTARQSAGGIDVAKFVLIFREADLTVMISTNIPQVAFDAGAYTREQIETILATAKVEDSAAKAAELFRFNYLGPFQESYGLMGTTKAYNTSGSKPAQGQNLLIKEPTILVSPSIDDREIDTKLGAQRSFQALGGMKDKKITSEKDTSIAGLKGYQIIGETTDEASDTKIAINLVLLAGDPGGYYIMVGTTPMTDKDKFMPEIEKVFASFEPVKNKQ